MASKGITRAKVEERIRINQGTHVHDAAVHLRRDFQKVSRKVLKEASGPDPVASMRTKLMRWKLQGLPGHVAPRAHRGLCRLNGLVCPRVVAAVWRTLFNGWTTARRFQAQGQCLLGCRGPFQEDSIEHYAHCGVVRNFKAKFLWDALSLHEADARSSDAKGEFITLGLNLSEVDDDALARRAILVYAVYCTVNNIRHTNPATSGETVMDMMLQYTQEAVRGQDTSDSLGALLVDTA